MALIESKNLEMGSLAEDFSLVGVDGKIYDLASFDAAKVLVIIFMCNHCPYVQAVWSQLVQMQALYQTLDVQFVGINPNTANPAYEEETLDKMKEYAHKYEMNFPYLEDFNQEVAEAYQAECTPDLYVFDNQRRLAYHGRIDAGELDSAITALLEGGRPSVDQKPSMGCSIKWT